MHEKVLLKGSLELLENLETADPSFFEGWVLAGDTGLALQLGHRISEDFDFFRLDAFERQALHAVFKGVGPPYETLQDGEKTLTVLVGGVKFSFFQIADPFLFKAMPYRSLAVADARDIALMKLIAISGRGSRKDFVDLYTLLRSGPILQDYFDLLPKKYGAGRASTMHILKSLTSFDDAEQEPMPTMLEPFDWEECKKFFVRQAHAIVLPPHV